MTSIPPRCFTCNFVIGRSSILDEFEKVVEENENIAEFFARKNIVRICCKRMLLGYVNLDDEILKFDKNKKYPQE